MEIVAVSFGVALLVRALAAAILVLGVAALPRVIATTDHMRFRLLLALGVVLVGALLAEDLHLLPTVVAAPLLVCIYALHVLAGANGLDWVETASQFPDGRLRIVLRDGVPPS